MKKGSVVGLSDGVALLAGGQVDGVRMNLLGRSGRLLDLQVNLAWAAVDDSWGDCGGRCRLGRRRQGKANDLGLSLLLGLRAGAGFLRSFSCAWARSILFEHDGLSTFTFLLFSFLFSLRFSLLGLFLLGSGCFLLGRGSSFRLFIDLTEAVDEVINESIFVEAVQSLNLSFDLRENA